MQTDYKQIYQELSQKTGKSEQVYKDIGSFVFQETARMMKNPTSLIIKLKGVGSWHLRKKRMDIVVNEWVKGDTVLPQDEYQSDASYQEYLEKFNRYTTFKERLLDYDKYLSLKKETNAIRRETQVLLEPDKGENGRYKSS